MRLSPQSRNSVKHKSASVEFANQTGGRVLNLRLEFNYKNRSKLFEARDTNFESIFYGPSLLFVLLLADSHACLQQQSRRLEAVYSRLGSCYSFHKGSKALNLSVKTTTTT